ncbi:MAG: metallophosphoesterase [Armatimonadetes bacterium]|nr:metallophosphoesterase [Armatimonadota bacterium]
MRARPPTKGDRPSNPKRRRFLRRALIGGGVVVGGGTLWSLFGERTWLTARQVSVPIRDLPPVLDGFTIAHLSDLHRGPYISEGQVREAVQMAMSYAPDLIVLTGDHLSLSARYAKSCAGALSGLSAEYGVFGVLGNHEYWTHEVDRVTTSYRDAGITMLINDSVPVVVGDAIWWLCGVDDIWEGKVDLEKALAKVPDEHFRILLCHEPDYADTAAEHDIPLQLSGHSHGGQIRLPWVGPVRLPVYAFKYPYGLQQVPGSTTQVYTTAGVGVTFPPIRINCRPEVSILRLSGV